MKRLGLLISGILLVTSFMVAQISGGTVKGQVFHNDGITPYNGCVVLLENINRSTSGVLHRSDPTDDLGNYSIGSVPPGIYKVKLLRPNKRKARKTLTIVHVVSGQTVEHPIFDRSKKGTLGFLRSPCTFVVVLLTSVLFFL